MHDVCDNNVIIWRKSIKKEESPFCFAVSSCGEAGRAQGQSVSAAAQHKATKISPGRFAIKPLYVDNWYCDTYTIQHELKDAMMLIIKPEMKDSEKEKAVGKD